MSVRSTRCSWLRVRARNDTRRGLRGESCRACGPCFALVAFGIWLGWFDSARAHPPIVLPLVFHVAESDGHPVVSEAFLHQRLERANRIFEPHGVRFTRAGAAARLPDEHAVVVTRQQRDAFGSRVTPGAIHCFVVRTLIDVDEPPRPRRGVHWRSRIGARAHYVILSSIAEPDVLAHELGHYLGNPGHSTTRGNLMSYERGDGLPVLDALQLQRMRARIAALIRRRELRPQREASTARAK